MKQASKIVFGLALIAAGVLWILVLCNVIVIPPDFSLAGWWTLFIIVPCLFGLANDRDKIGPCIGLAMGVLLLLAARSVISWQDMWQYGLAVIIIGIGLKILLFRGCGKCECNNHGVCEQQTISRDGKEIRFIESSFGKQEFTFAGEKFEGADVKSSFGALKLDLNGADISADAFIDLNVGFAGVTIIVPENLSVRIAVSSGFGGVQDNRRNKVTTGTPTLIITGKVGFGGVEIRN